MHTNNLVHRDIKSENVVYSDSGKGEQDFSKLEVKLVDFGFSRISINGTASMVEFVGTPYYIAPEIVNQEAYGSKCDIWSLGVLVYEIIAGEYPFQGRSRNELFKRITLGRFQFKHAIWDNVTPEARSFINMCLTIE